MLRPPEVLVCDDDPIFHLAVKQALKHLYSFRSAYSGDEALAILRKHPVDALLLDIQMKDRTEGLHLIPRFLEIDPELAIIMSSAITDFRIVREAMKLGAYDYIAKNSNSEELTLTLHKVLERRSLLKRQGQQDFEVLSAHKRHLLVGNSRPIQQLRRILEKVRKSSANVVITGETGTGKELVARQLRHALPNGNLAPFLAIDSSTIQQSTAESTLFGHEKGAFTGAEKLSRGLFEEAHQGIVYFDEISNMPLSIQPKLLRVLQEKEISRLGSSRVIPLDFRVICATNMNLDDLAKTGDFKEDLLQRLNVIPIHVPPLRERIEDLPLLVEHFIQKQGTRCLKFSEPTLRILEQYSWPGNVRELASLVAYISTMAEQDEITPDDLPTKFQTPASETPLGLKSFASNNEKWFYNRVSRFEKELLTVEYQQSSGNITQLAEVLGMDRSHLYTKLKDFGIHSIRPRPGFPKKSSPARVGKAEL